MVKIKDKTTGIIQTYERTENLVCMTTYCGVKDVKPDKYKSGWVVVDSKNTEITIYNY